jgi:hypothetical protein
VPLELDDGPLLLAGEADDDVGPIGGLAPEGLNLNPGDVPQDAQNLWLEATL